MESVDELEVIGETPPSSRWPQGLDMMLDMIVAYRAKSPTYWVELRNWDIIDAIWRWHLKEYGASRPESGPSMFQVSVLSPGVG